MPVLNVPFRLIFAMNPSRGGVLDNNLQPEKAVQVPVRGGDDLLDTDITKGNYSMRVLKISDSSRRR